MSTQGRILTLAALFAAVIGAYWVFALAPKRAEIAKVDDQVAQAESRRAAAVATVASAGRDRAAYQRDYANVARLGKAAPPDDDVASLVFQLESVARADRIDFRSVKLSNSGAAPAAAAAEEPSTAKSSGDTADAGASAGKDKTAAAGADATAPTPAAPAVAQAPPGAVVGSAGLITLPFTFTFDGGYLPTQRLLGAIDRLADATDGTIAVNGRLLTVDGFALTAGRLGFPKVKAVVSATAYIVPPADGVLAGATAQGPGATTKPAGAAQPPATATAATTTRGVG